QVTALLLLNMLLRHWNTTLAYTLFSFGYDRQYSITIMLDASVSAICFAILPCLMGIIGVPLGLLIGVSLVSLPANLAVVARESATFVWPFWVFLVPRGWLFTFLFALGIAWSRLWLPDPFSPPA